MKKGTQCVHSGSMADIVTGGLNTPIFTSSAFKYLEQDEVVYPRYYNTPNQKAVVEKMAALEEAEDGVLFSSGMAAISSALLAFARRGDHVVLMKELYGGTHFFATQMFDRFGITYSFVETDPEAIRAAAGDKTTVIVIESPTNPLLHVIDIRKVAAFARDRGIVTIIDNTFATPVNQMPISLGIDIAVHSGTKYLGGHSDLCCGVAVTSREKTEKIRAAAINLGGSLNAQDCYLLERSLKTLALRVERQSENALRIAEFLDAHPAVNQVYYPGLPGFPGHDFAAAQMKNFGGMLSFELAPGCSSDAFIAGLELIKVAVSLGGVESTICMPVMTSHAKVAPDERRRIGISESLFRLSVGIEDPDDLIDELDRALSGRV